MTASSPPLELPARLPDGHAMRAARRMLWSSGAETRRDDELLAILIGGRDPLLAARSLLARCGDLAGVARADAAEYGPLGERRAASVMAAIEIGRRAAAAWPSGQWQIRSPAELAERLLPAMGHLEREELRVLLLNTKNAVIGMVTVYSGNLAGSPVRVGEVYRDAVRRQAASLVVAHNHPSGDPTPSADDLRVTADLAQAGRLLDIELLDHLVIGHGRWVSLRSLGAL